MTRTRPFFTWKIYAEFFEDTCLHCDRTDPKLRNMFRGAPTELIDILIMIHRIISNFPIKTDQELLEDAIFFHDHIEKLRKSTSKREKVLSILAERIIALKKAGHTPDPHFEILHPEEVPDEYIP
jgi:hypothetical protein